MARREFEILDKNGNGRSNVGRYEIIQANLEGKPNMYEFVGKIEDNCGHFAVYRDKETTSSIFIEGEDRHSLLAIVGEKSTFDKTFDRIKATVPDIFTFKQKGRKR